MSLPAPPEAKRDWGQSPLPLDNFVIFWQRNASWTPFKLHFAHFSAFEKHKFLKLRNHNQHHHQHMLDPILSPSTELAGFRMVIVFLAISFDHVHPFPSPLFFISFSTCFFPVCFGLPLPLLPLTSNFKAFTITFSSSFLKT